MKRCSQGEEREEELIGIHVKGTKKLVYLLPLRLL